MKKAMTIQDLAELRDILANCTDSQYECVKAYAHAVACPDKAEIQRFNGFEEWVTKNPKEAFSTDDIMYRIKPKSKFIPFSYSDAGYLKNRWVMPKDKTAEKGEYIIQAIMPEGIMLIGIYRVNWQSLFNDFTFTDGSPCGKESK